MGSARRRLSPDDELVGSLHDIGNDIPPSLDWREKGFVTPPENQESCGSCYAYSVANSISGQIFKQTGMLIPLSVQQIVDCSSVVGNLGCSGGSLRNTMKYLEKSGGLMKGEQYPYISEVSSGLRSLSNVVIMDRKHFVYDYSKENVVFVRMIAL